jgi:predicted transcriptional regulator
VNLHSKKLNKDDSITLDILSVMDSDKKVTQRTLAQDLNIALGMTNLYIKRCIEKGLLKINQIPSKRYKYYITKKGFTEKARLTQEYLKASFNLYREATEELRNIFKALDKEKKYNIVLSNISEISDIAMLASLDFKLKIIAVIDDNRTEKFYKNIPIIANISECKKYDLVILTSLLNAENRFNELSKSIHFKKIIVPSFLNFKLKRKS